MNSGKEVELFLSPYKICHHFDRLGDWLKEGECYPISISFDLTLRCGHNCPNCPYKRFRIVSCQDYFNSWGRIRDALDKLKKCGVRSILFTGGGEPLCNIYAKDAMIYAKKIGFHVALITNGELIDNDVAKTIIETCDWVRISIDAASESVYNKTHGISGETFRCVCQNVMRLVQLKKSNESKTTIGVGMLTSSITIDQMQDFAKLACEMHTDYCQFRPLQNPSKKDIIIHRKIFLSEIEATRVVVKEKKTRVVASKEKYNWILRSSNGYNRKCYAPHFASVVGADGVMYVCPHLRYKHKYAVTDLSNNIWNLERRKKLTDLVSSLPAKECPSLCKYESLNRFLSSVLDSCVHPDFL